jgi:tetratricopeptide (TPR) repeat protein
VKSFGLTVSAEDKKRIEVVTKDLSDDSKAFELYLQARQEFFKSTPDSYEKAISLYEKALKAKSDFAFAWAGLSTASLYWGYERSWNGQSYVEFYKKALSAAVRSVEIAPKLSETHTALALVYAYWLPEPRRNEAEAEAKKAISFNRNNAEAYFAISKARNGDIEYLKKTIELNPQYILAYNWLANTYDRLGDLDSAIAMHKIAIGLNPEWALEYANLGYCYYRQGRYREALAMAEKAIALKGDLKPAYDLKALVEEAMEQ